MKLLIKKIKDDMATLRDSLTGENNTDMDCEHIEAKLLDDLDSCLVLLENKANKALDNPRLNGITYEGAIAKGRKAGFKEMYSLMERTRYIRYSPTNGGHYLAWFDTSRVIGVFTSDMNMWKELPIDDYVSDTAGSMSGKNAAIIACQEIINRGDLLEHV